MRNLFRKPWFTGTLIIGLMLIVFFLNLWIMSMKLTFPYQNNNFWQLAANLSVGNFANIYGFIFMLLFYISILPILLSGLSFIRKSNWGFMSGIIYFLVFESLFIIFQSIFGYLSIFSLILVIINFVLIVGMFVFLIFRKVSLQQSKALIKSEKEVKLTETKIPLFVLLIDVIAILVLISTFVVPVYSMVEGNTIYYAILVNVLFFGDTRLEVLIYFLGNFALFLGMLMYFANCISNYFYDKDAFVKKSKNLVTLSFTITLMFFLMGLVMNIVHTLNGVVAQTFAFIPMSLIIGLIFVFSIFLGKFNAFNKVVNKEFKLKYPRIEPLVYVILMTAVSAVLLLLYVIKIEITSTGYTSNVNLTGIDILRDYANLDPGYRMVAFALVVMLIAIGITLVVAIAAYLAKYRHFNSMVRAAAGVNIFFVFILGISGYYFQIGQQIDQTVILGIFDYYGIGVPAALDYEYAIRTDAIYALIASVFILVIMIMRKAFDRDELSLLDANLQVSGDPAGGGSGSGASSHEISEDTFNMFDPCPGFTELDSKVDAFMKDIEERRTNQKTETTLNELVNFIVEYARNSRLHLSYTPEDIATFVAGLGASKLSILQGMSGTGKTSLPKIFSEAIFGNCEIIEVESSWKDKNELLGYYNEFSMKYTPKKFTLALYKAALNQDIFTFILLDEMNLSRIEYYFSDFLSLMENEEGHREIKLINIKLARSENGESTNYLALDEGHTLKVPDNVWFIGTANRDESTFVISDKVYDRAHTMNFTKRAPKVRNYANPMPKQYYNYETINQLFLNAKANGDFDAEQNEVIKGVEMLLSPFNISFGNRILKQIEDFVNIYKACFPEEDVEKEAVEKILLSKVVAKLEVKTIDDKEKLEMAFEKLGLGQCVDFIKRLDSE